MPHIIWFLIPIFLGLCQPFILQMTIRLAKAAGDMPAAAILHLVGALTGGVFMLLGLRGGDGNWGELPWWAWLGGVIGVCCLWLMNTTIPKIGIASAMSIMVASQLIASLLVEKHEILEAGFREPQWFNWLGVVFLTAGAFLVSKNDFF